MSLEVLSNVPDVALFAVAVVLLVARHLWVTLRGTESQETLALRRAWVARVLGEPGCEILAVQTLRNSIMAASVMASTSAVGLMGVVSLGHLRAPQLMGDAFHLKYVFPVLLLAACVVLFSKAVRLYHRCSFMVGLSRGTSPMHAAAESGATDQLVRASHLYRHGWRIFYAAIATGAWLVSGWLSLLVTVALLAVDILARAE